MNLKKNIELLKLGKSLLPGGSTFNKTNFFDNGKTPFSLVSGKGSVVKDVDGNKYDDFINGLGCIFLGYNFEKINNSIKKQLKKGISLPLSNPLEQIVAKKLISMIPCAQMVRYGKNGSDVLTQAVKLSRYITKKDHVIYGGYHGWHDWCIARTSRNGGIPKDVKILSHKFVFNEIDSLKKKYKALNGNVACVVMDTVARYYPKPGFLKAVRNFTKKKKIILVFDEIVTGFRIHSGGAQAYFGVIPDLACFGKAIANGMPLSALVGKKKFMKKFDEIFYAINFASETLSLAAANTTLDFYKKNDVSKNVFKKGHYLKKELIKAIERNNLENILEIQGMNSRLIIGFKNNLDSDFTKKKSDSLNMIIRFMIETFAKNKILTNLSIFISYSHTKNQLDHFIETFNQICRKLKFRFYN